jgi:aminopeptidase N
LKGGGWSRLRPGGHLGDARSLGLRRTVTRDGHYVALVLSGGNSVRRAAVLQTLLNQARVAAQQFADPAWRPVGLPALAEDLLGLARAAGPGGEEQLGYFQVFVTLAVSAEHLRLVRRLLEGSEELPGLTVDTDLRWALLRRLVVNGLAGPAEIDAELGRDATAGGQRSAATCRAAIGAARPKPKPGNGSSRVSSRTRCSRRPWMVSSNRGTPTC